MTEEGATWTEGMDEESVGFIDNKGWKTSADVVGAYRSLESFNGVPAERMVKIPAEDDADGMNAMFAKLGRPEEAGGYELNAGDSPDQELVDGYRTAAHSMGLSQQQAEGMLAWYGEFGEGRSKSTQEQSAVQLANEEAAMKSELGSAYDETVSLAKQAFSRFGVETEIIDTLEKTLGFSGVMKFMAEVAKSTGEHTFEGGSDAGTFTMSPGQAQASVSDMKNDKPFMERYMRGDSDAVKKMQGLMALAYPNG